MPSAMNPKKKTVERLEQENAKLATSIRLALLKLNLKESCFGYMHSPKGREDRCVGQYVCIPCQARGVLQKAFSDLGLEE